MSEIPRDTHFQGFAKLLWEQLNFDGLANVADSRLSVTERDRVNREIEHATQKVIAQRVYDLMYHQMEHVYRRAGNAIFHGEIPGSIEMMPDMTEWPKEQV